MRISSRDFTKDRNGVLIYSPQESSIYPAQNLNSWRLEKRARILKPKALYLDGIEEHGYREDSAILTPNNKLTVQAWINTTLPDQYHSILGQYANIKSWWFYHIGSALRLSISEDGSYHYTAATSPGGVGHLKFSYDGELGTIRGWWNMNEITVSHPSLPATLANSTDSLTLGASSYRNTHFFNGSLRDVAFKFSADTDGAPLDPKECIGYYPLQENMNDISGNDLHLTPTAIAEINYQSVSQNVHVFVRFPESVTYDFLMLDRRHNLQTGSTVKFLKSDGSLITEVTVLAGKAVAV